MKNQKIVITINRNMIMTIATKTAAQVSNYQTDPPQKSERMYVVRGYKLFEHAPLELVRIAQAILSRAANEHWPMPSDLPFTFDGKKYVAQYQWHGKNRDHAGKHAGVALYEEASAASNDTKHSNTGSKLDDGFFIKLNEMCGRLNINPKDMLAIMQLESGLNPHVISYQKNGKPHLARGLNQIIDLKAVGWNGTRDEYARLSASEQLPYVENYFKQYSKAGLNSAALLYVANFWPAALKNPAVRAGDLSAVIITKDRYPREYNYNQGLDADKDGKITYGDFVRLMKYDQKVLDHNGTYARFDQVIGKTPSQPGQSPNTNNQTFDNMLAWIKEKLESIATNNSPSIIITSEDLSSKLEYARILSSILKKELNIDTGTYTNKDNVEIRCFNQDNTLLLRVFSSDIAQIFNQVTGCQISTIIKHSIDVGCQELDIKLAEMHHRKFRLKLYGKKNK